MKMPNTRANGLLSRAGYGGVDGTPRPQPTSDTFRNARLHQPRHGSSDIEGEPTPRRPAMKQTVVNVNVGADKSEVAAAKQEGMKAGVQLGAKLALAKMSGGAAPRGPAPMPMPQAPPPMPQQPQMQSGPAPAPMPAMRRGGGIC